MFSAIYISLSLFDAVAETTSLPESDRWTRHGRLKVQRRVQSGAFKVWKQKEIHKKKKKKKSCFTPELNRDVWHFIVLRQDILNQLWIDGWMDGWKQKEGLKSHWKGFKRWHWWPGGRPRGRTAPAGRRWRRRGWVLRTWGQPWSCRPPGRLPAPPPDGPDARRGRDTWGGERKEGEESRGSKIGRQEEKGYGREILLQKRCKNNKKQKEKDEAKKSVEEKNRTTQAVWINPT